MRFASLLCITKGPSRAWVGSVSNKHNPSTKSGLGACISSRITTVIHVMVDHQINYNCFNEPFAVSPCRSLYWDMHGLIFETSIWLLAGSTRFVRFRYVFVKECWRCVFPRIHDYLSLSMKAECESCECARRNKEYAATQRSQKVIVKFLNKTVWKEAETKWHVKQKSSFF